MRLHESLDRYTLDALQAMAQATGLKDPPRQKTPLARDLSAHLRREEVITASLAKLTDLERQAFDCLQALGAEAGLYWLERKLGNQVRPLQTWRGKPADAGKPTVEQLAMRLTRQGLVFSRRAHGKQPLNLEPDSIIGVPEEIRLHLPGLQKAVARLPEEKIDEVVEAAPRNLLRDLYLYWNHVREHGLTLNQRDQVPKNDLKRINGLLSQPEDLSGARQETETRRLYFLRVLLTEGGLLAAKRDRALQPEKKAEEFFQQSTFARLSALLGLWQRTKDYNEVLRLPGLSPDFPSKPDHAPSELIQARAFFLKELRECPVGPWLDVATLVQHLHDFHRDFLFPHQASAFGIDNRYYKNPFGVSFRAESDQEGWVKVEQALITSFLAEFLHGFGVVDLARRKGELVGFRITPAGAALLGLTEPPEEEEAETRLVVQPNFEIVVFEPAPDALLATLDRFCDRVRMDRAVEYRLSRESVYRAQQEGLTAEEILATLGRESRQPIPQNVAYSLREWGDLYGQITIRSGVRLLQAASPELLDELLERREGVPRIAARLGPTAARLAGGKDQRSLEQIRQTFAAAGYSALPVREKLDQEPPSLNVYPDGRIEFRHGLPHFFLRGALRPYTEELNGQLMLSPEAVRQRLAERKDLDEFVAFLRHHTVGALPKGLLADLKRWSGYFGAATTEEVTLLTVENEEILKELLADPDLARRLQPFRPQGAVAVVKSGELRALKKALREKGVEL